MAVFSLSQVGLQQLPPKGAELTLIPPLPAYSTTCRPGDVEGDLETRIEVKNALLFKN